MSYDTFWYGSLDSLDIYQEKKKMEIQEWQHKMDTSAWMQGKYILAALAAVLGDKKHPYPNTPYLSNAELSIQQKEKQEEMRHLIQTHNLMVAAKTGGKLG